MKAYFLSRHIREKILLLGFVAFAVIFWGSKLYSRTTELRSDTNKIEDEIAGQVKIISTREEVEQRRDQLVSQLDPAKSYDTLKLPVKIEEIATKVNLNQPGSGTAAIAQTIPTKTALMTLTKTRLTLQNVEMQNVVDFYRELSDLAPYISIVAFRITAANARGGNGGGPNGPNNNAAGSGADGITSTVGIATNPGGRRGGPTTIAPTTPGGAFGALATTTGRGRAPNAPPGSRLTVNIDLTAVAINRPKAPAQTTPPKATAKAPAPAS